MKDNTIYMKLDQSVQVVNKKVTIGDIAQIQCSDYAVTKHINKIVALQVKGDKNQKKVISSLKLIELIRREIREAQIVLVGETELIGYEGMASNAYFEVLPILILNQKTDFPFHGRNRRPPRMR